ncbi:M-phase-specific PLK1-interacting protein-like [Anneissia japonica]|uniref:M-phase-specific PLK1-interacting protein-like n=1 Tax=Anneissia japonica TaxID=1529436 RepID=UPI0014259ECD|nr:M-phase-specific PLK1-interacting protein-like [Anneissia japonica]
MNSGRYNQARGSYHHGQRNRQGSASRRGQQQQASLGFRSPPPGMMMGSPPWDYSPSPRGTRGGHMSRPSPRYRGPSPCGYNQRNSPYNSPYSPQSQFPSPNHPNFSPRGFHTSSPLYGSPGRQGHGRVHSRRGWNQNKGRGSNKGSWNSNDISIYYSPAMVIDPWKELENLHISSCREKASDKDNET